MNIPTFAALVLLLLTMITTHMTGGLYARYTTTGSSKNSARVAKFDVDFTLTGSGKDFQLTVLNGSEVTIRYIVTVVPDSHLSVTLDDMEGTIAADGSVTFENADWILAPGEDSDALPLVFSVENWADLTDADKNNGATEPVQRGFTVKVTAVQED